MCQLCRDAALSEQATEVEEEKTIGDLYEQMEDIKATLSVILNKLRNMEPSSD